MTLIRARLAVLVVDEKSAVQTMCRTALTKAGYMVGLASDGAAALAAFRQEDYPLVVLNLSLPDASGLEIMRDMLESRPETRVIVMTTHSSVRNAVEAMRAGALDFLVQPFDEDRLLTATAQAVPRPLPGLQNNVEGEMFIGTSAPMRAIHARINSVARSTATVFITGESGTGKELCALAVHGNSSRATGPFIALNCGAIPQDLLESEVFGHMKGSFTGAIADKPGAAAAADGGTLFLDEVCEMAPTLQTKLLRFLQTSTVVPVGATRPRKVDVRIVCATNRDPLAAVRRGEFREDLFYRLYVVPIHMPPLRDRGEDVVEIARAALNRFSQEEGKRFVSLTPEVEALFRRMPWPGNVRQVLNVMRNIVVLNDGVSVSPSMLPDTLDLEGEWPPAPADPPQAQLPLEALLGRPFAEIERRVIEATLDLYDGSVPKAARVLELSPSTLYRKIEGWSKG